MSDVRFEAEIDEGSEAEQTQWAIVTRPISNWATVIKLTMERLPLASSVVQSSSPLRFRFK